MAKLYTLSHLVIIRDDEEARNRNWVTDQEDYLVRNLGRGLWAVCAIPRDGSTVYLRTAELERRYLRRPDTEVHVYKAWPSSNNCGARKPRTCATDSMRGVM